MTCALRVAGALALPTAPEASPPNVAAGLQVGPLDRFGPAQADEAEVLGSLKALPHPPGSATPLPRHGVR